MISIHSLRCLATLSVMFAVEAGAIPRQNTAPVPSERSVVLKDSVKSDGLPAIIASNLLGLGEEAARLAVWLRSTREPVILSLKGANGAVQGAAGHQFQTTPAMTNVLTRLDQWYGLTASPGHPITHRQMSEAVLSPGSIKRIQELFERTILRGVRADGAFVVPETGGEATIDSELHFFEVTDPRWASVRELAQSAADPKAVADLYVRMPLEMSEVDAHGLIRNAIGRFKLGMNGAAAEVLRAVNTVIKNAAPTYTHEPDLQFALIASREWSGRYVGQWHTHSPHYGTAGWTGGDVPSFEDMQNAIAAGQYLTLSFQPDGFDLYDAEPLADAGKVDLSLLKVIRYRSAAWRDHFQKLKQKIDASR